MSKHGVGSHALAAVRKYFPKVDKVNDADKGITVEVTAKDVKASARKDHEECAMAIAARRSEHADGVIISSSTAYVIKGNVATRYDVPESVAREVVSFDRGAAFEVGSYTLRKMRPGRRLDANRAGGGPTGPHTSKRKVHITTNIRTVLGSDVER